MRNHARALVSAMVAALVVAGCAGALPPATTTSGGTAPLGPPASAVRRCADGDPDRLAWFCVIGRALYNTAAALQSDSARRR